MPDRYGEEPQDLDVPDREWAATARAQAKAMAIVNCGLCDDDGYRGTRVCDHRDHTEAAKRGMAKVRSILDAGRKRRASSGSDGAA